MPIVDKDLAAGVDVVGSTDPIQLFAGDKEIVTDDNYVVANGQGVLPKYSVVAILTSSGKLVKHVPGASDGSQIAVGITTQKVDATSADAKVAIYKSGFFNHLALTWHANTNTLALRKAVFERTPIAIGSVRL
jgi:hypothetical protein